MHLSLSVHPVYTIRRQPRLKRATTGLLPIVCACARLAKEHNYVPNQVARSLVVGRTNLIGLVTHSLAHITPMHDATYRIQALAQSETAFF